MVAALTLLTLGADVDRARFEKVGHELVCTCGCNQILLECNHVGCPVSDGMRKQVTDGLIAGKSDDAILQSFVDQLGPTVLAAPTKAGFDRVAWIMPFAVFIAGIGIVLYFVRHWQARFKPAQAYATSPQPVDSFVEQARRETEL